MKAINVSELKAHLSKYLRLASRGARIVVKDCDDPGSQLGPPRGEGASWRGAAGDRRPGTLGDRETALKRKELTELLAKLDLAPIDRMMIDRAKSSFAVNLRALAAIHGATAEIRPAESEGEPLEFWTHDDRQATAALSRGLTVHG